MDKRLKLMLTMAADSPAAVRNYRMAAGIFIKHRLIAVGYPQLKTHPLQAKYTHAPEKKLHLHAEVNAIAKAAARIWPLDLTKATLVVARAAYVSDKPGALSRSASACPCEGCFRAINGFGIKKVLWTEDDFDANNFF